MGWWLLEMEIWQHVDILQRTASTAICCDKLHHTAIYYNALKHAVTQMRMEKLRLEVDIWHQCNKSQHTATHYNILQHAATYCNIL